MEDDQQSRQERISELRDRIVNTTDTVSRGLLEGDAGRQARRIAADVGELRRQVEELAEAAAAAGIDVELRGGRAGSDLVARIVDDPAATPLLEAYMGYFGTSSRSDYDRLYISPDMSTYLDIPKDAIVADAVAENETGQPIPRSVVWIKAGTQVIRTRVEPMDVQRSFLSGSFTQGHCGCGKGEPGGSGHGHHCGCPSAPPGGGPDSRVPC